MTIKHALITGGAKRIGRVIALHLAKAGWDITLHYHASEADAQKLAQEIREIGRKAYLLKADFEDENLVGRLLPKNTEHPITALVHNASLFERDENDPDGSRHNLVNYDVPMLLSQQFSKQLPNDQIGSIIFFLDNTPMPIFLKGYSHSRDRLRQVLQSMAKQFAPQARVNALALGPTLKNERESDTHFQSLVKQTPLGAATRPEDVAAATLLLLHTESICGQIINVDCGMHLLG